MAVCHDHHLLGGGGGGGGGRGGGTGETGAHTHGVTMSACMPARPDTIS